METTINISQRVKHKCKKNSTFKCKEWKLNKGLQTYTELLSRLKRSYKENKRLNEIEKKTDKHDDYNNQIFPSPTNNSFLHKTMLVNKLVWIKYNMCTFGF